MEYNEKLDMSLEKKALSMILKNRVYLGEFTYDGPVEKHRSTLKNHHNPIIAVNIFGKVQKALARNRKK
jgi:hypothetical protein